MRYQGGNIQYCNGSSWQSFGTSDASGTVTEVATGTGLTGGPITENGTISIAAGGVSATELASDAVTTDKILNGAVTDAKISDVDISKVTGLGDIAEMDSADFLQSSNNLSDLASAETARTNLGLGSAATYTVGTAAGNLVELDGSGLIPSSVLPAMAASVGVAGNIQLSDGSGGFADSGWNISTGTLYGGDATLNDIQVQEIIANSGDFAELQVNSGVFNIVPTPLPTSPSAGSVAVDSGDGNTLKYHNGTDWVEVGGGEVTAAGDVGEIQFNDGDNNFTSSVDFWFEPFTNSFGINSATIEVPGDDLILQPTFSGNIILDKYSGSNVGIGTTSPATRLDVAGAVRIGDDTATCDGPLAGALRYQGGNVQFCNGSDWQSFGTSDASGTVTEVATGTGLTGGPITESGTISIAAGGVSATELASDAVTTDKILNGAVTDAKINDVDISKITGLGDIAEMDAADFLQSSNNLSDVANAATARTNLGLGTMATEDSGDFLSSANNLSDVANPATARTNLGLGTAATYTVGTAAGNLVELDGSGQIPASVLPSMGASFPLLADPVGSASAPAYSFDGDTDTGMYSSGADRISFATGGVERMVVRENGRVSVGGVGPWAMLHVGDSSDSNDIAIGDPNRTNGGAGITFMSKLSGANGFSSIYNNWEGDLGLYTAENRRLRFGWSNGSGGFTTQMVFNSDNGRLGIGTESPEAELHVVGDIQYTGTITDISDRRLKEDIAPLSRARDILRQIGTYSYYMKDDDTQRTEFGVIAQEIYEVLPELVRTVDQDKGYMGVNYIGLVPWSIRAINEIDEEVVALRKENEELKSRVSELESKFEMLAEQLQQLSNKK